MQPSIPSTIDHLPAPCALARDYLGERTVKRELIAELRQSWVEGAPVPVDDLLRRWPCDPATDPDVAGLRLEDRLQRTRVVAVPAAEGGETSPDSVENLLADQRIMHSLGVSTSAHDYLRMPELGESVFGFLLVAELGRGAFARVFLARQADLAGRLVVLKISKSEGTEPQTLALLQHTNIVPIYSVHEDERAGLRALCMPYFGGASMSDVLRKVWPNNTQPQLGIDLIRALDEATVRYVPKTEAVEQTPRGRVAALDYDRAVVWMLAALADGLAHAHQRGVLHRDIKPSNILLSDEGQPMLLDFNLAHDASQTSGRAVLGGTIMYMSPEHLRAMATRGDEQVRSVDRRADIYSLGMVLYEMLTGRRAFDQSASHTPLPMMVEAMTRERGQKAPSLRQARPTAPWGLESIVRRCLAPDPAQRYQRAEELAEDLRCFLDDRALRHAPELSVRERAEKWVRRHPRWSVAGIVAAAAACLLLGAGLLLSQVRDQLADTSDRLAGARAEERKRRFQEGAVQALFYVNTKNELADHQALGEKAARETLDLYEILDRDDWQNHPDWRRLAPEERGRLSADARELLLLLAGARVRRAQHEKHVLGEALALLERAEHIPSLPPCQALVSDRAAYLERLGDAAGASQARARAREIPANTARDHYLLATACVREQKVAAAVDHLNEAVRLNPRDYWSWMQRGLCYQDLGHATLAVSDFGTCVGLRPDFAWSYYARAVALAAAGQRQEALADYARALDFDPRLLSARLNAGMLHLELKQYAAAWTQLRQVAEAGRDDAALHCGMGFALEKLGRHKEADDAFARARQGALTDKPEARLRILRAYAFAVADRLPGQADETFELVLREAPLDAEALYGCGMLHDRKGEQMQALECFTRALQTAPAFEEARRFRAIILARRGDYAAARIDINACLSKETPSGATYYAAACVAALQAQKSNPETAALCRREAIQMLGEAFRRDYGFETAKTDEDLRCIRDHLHLISNR